MVPRKWFQVWPVYRRGHNSGLPGDRLPRDFWVREKGEVIILLLGGAIDARCPDQEFPAYGSTSLQMTTVPVASD